VHNPNVKVLYLEVAKLLHVDDKVVEVRSVNVPRTESL
jgi:hypothetical protein